MTTRAFLRIVACVAIEAVLEGGGRIARVQAAQSVFSHGSRREVILAREIHKSFQFPPSIMLSYRRICEYRWNMLMEREHRKKWLNGFREKKLVEAHASDA